MDIFRCDALIAHMGDLGWWLDGQGVCVCVGGGGYLSGLKPKKGRSRHRPDNHAYLGDHSLRLANIQDIVTL